MHWGNKNILGKRKSVSLYKINKKSGSSPFGYMYKPAILYSMHCCLERVIKNRKYNESFNNC